MGAMGAYGANCPAPGPSCAIQYRASPCDTLVMWMWKITSGHVTASQNRLPLLIRSWLLLHASSVPGVPRPIGSTFDTRQDRIDLVTGRSVSKNVRQVFYDNFAR